MKLIYLILFLLNFNNSHLDSSKTPKPKAAQMKLKWDYIDGDTAHPNLFLFHVSIRDTKFALCIADHVNCYLRTKYMFSSDLIYGFHICSASLISTQHLITSAQCVLYKNPIHLQAVVGSMSLSKGGVLHAISQIHLHPNHIRNNIAVLKISSPSETMFYILLQKKSFASESTLVLSGWEGRNKSLCNYLQFVPLTLLSYSICNAKFGLELTDVQFCALTIADEGPCVGNFGSPLVTVNLNLIRLTGIMFYNDLCVKEYPTILVNVSHYVSWIRDKCDNCVLF